MNLESSQLENGISKVEVTAGNEFLCWGAMLKDEQTESPSLLLDPVSKEKEIVLQLFESISSLVVLEIYKDYSEKSNPERKTSCYDIYTVGDHPVHFAQAARVVIQETTFSVSTVYWGITVVNCELAVAILTMLRNYYNIHPQTDIEPFKAPYLTNIGVQICKDAIPAFYLYELDYSYSDCKRPYAFFRLLGRADKEYPKSEEKKREAATYRAKTLYNSLIREATKGENEFFAYFKATPSVIEKLFEYVSKRITTHSKAYTMFKSEISHDTDERFREGETLRFYELFSDPVSDRLATLVISKEPPITNNEEETSQFYILPHQSLPTTNPGYYAFLGSVLRNSVHNTQLNAIGEPMFEDIDYVLKW
jgi:hypothetical protein